MLTSAGTTFRYGSVLLTTPGWAKAAELVSAIPSATNVIVCAGYQTTRGVDQLLWVVLVNINAEFI